MKIPLPLPSGESDRLQEAALRLRAGAELFTRGLDERDAGLALTALLDLNIATTQLARHLEALVDPAALAQLTLQADAELARYRERVRGLGARAT